MKSKLVKWLGIVCACAMLMGSMAACGNSAESTTSTKDGAEAGAGTAGTENGAETGADTADTEGAADTKDLSGSITMAGSTSMEKVANALAESFMEKYPNVTVTAEFIGSGAGLESLAAGSVDIGNASRALSDSEFATGATENIIAIDGIGVITDTANTIEDLTSEDLAAIYKGEITNWSDLGGADENIVVIGREAGSGTRDAFEELLDIKDACSYAQELDSTGAVLAKVAATPGAVGYVSLDVVDDTVSLVSVDGVEASEDNILNGNYLLSRPFVMATMGTISEQSELVQAWFAYINSEEGQQVIAGQGLFLPN